MYCKVVVDSIPCLVRDTSHMLNIIGDFNIEDVQVNALLFSFDITNMFLSDDNETGIQRVRSKLNEHANTVYIPVDCVNCRSFGNLLEA